MKRNFLLIIAISFLFCSCENSFFTNVAKLYKVKFSTNGGTPIEAVYTNEITESPYSEKSDCDLQGWYLTSDYTGGAVIFPLEVTEPITLYAKWLQKYSVVFNTNGGSAIPSQMVARIETSPLSIKEDYELEGWYENADFSGGKVEFPYIVTKAIILNAQWTRVFNATFEVNGGTQIGNSRVTVINESPSTTKNGFSFAGWYTSSDFSGEPVTFPFELTADINFYAKWVEKFTVAFETNGGSSIDSIETGYIEKEPVTKKTDFSFGGWYFDSGFTQKVDFPYEVKSNITLYAKWNPIQCTVIYNANGATSGTVPASETVDKGSSYTVKGNTGNLLKGEYAFTKWNTKADGTGTNYSAGGTMTVTGDVTLYAQWGKDYARMIDVEGGTFTMGDADSGDNIKHQVTVSSFRIAAYELTYEIWSEVYSWAIQNGYVLEDAQKGVTDQDKFSDFEPATKISWNMAVVWLNAYSEMKGLEPVYSDGEKICKNCVTSDDFKVVFDKNANGYRLPTEAEWEFAAGGGNYEYRDDLKYSGDNKIENVAWYMDNSGRETHPVGKKESNCLGIYDMSGNVSEWCWDSLYAYSKDAVTNPINTVMTAEKVIRGGGYCTFSTYDYYYSKYDGLNIRIRNTGKRNETDSIGNTNTYEYSYKYFVGGIRVAQNAQ